MAALCPVSSVKPQVQEEACGPWTIDGFSWLRKKKRGEPLISPSILKVAGLEFGLAFFPGGLEDESLSPEGRCCVLVFARGKAKREAWFEVCILDQNTGARIFVARKLWSFEDGTGNGWGDFAKLEEVAALVRDDKLVFELSVNAWCKDMEVKHLSPESKVGSSDLSLDLENLLKSQKNADVVLQIDEAEMAGAAVRTLYAHKAILAARSPVFERMFSGGMKESGTDAKVNMCDTSFEVAGFFLHALYTDQIPSTAWKDPDLMCSLFSVLHKYEVEKLLSRCEEQIMRQLSETNVVERLMLADLLDRPSLKSAVLDFMAASPSRLAEVQATEGYGRLIQQRPKLLADILARSIRPAAKKARVEQGPASLPGNLEALTVAELKKLLSARSLATSGSKAVLIERLLVPCRTG